MLVLGVYKLENFSPEFDPQGPQMAPQGPQKVTTNAFPGVKIVSASVKI